MGGAGTSPGTTIGQDDVEAEFTREGTRARVTVQLQSHPPARGQLRPGLPSLEHCQVAKEGQDHLLKYYFFACYFLSISSPNSPSCWFPEHLLFLKHASPFIQAVPSARNHPLTHSLHHEFRG